MDTSGVIRKALDVVVEHYGKEYILRQAAEECSELSQAALKLIRAEKKEATTKSVEEARKDLIEEIADVTVMISQLMIIEDLNMDDVDHMIALKCVRSVARAMEVVPHG